MSFRQDGNEICVKYEQQKLVVKAIRDDIVNIFVPYRTKEHYSKAIDGDKAVATELTAEQKGEDLVIATDKIRMQFGENLEMVITRPDGTPLVRTHRQGRSVCGEVSEQMKQILESEGHDTSNLGAHDYPVQMMFDLDEGDDFYGLGDKTGFLNKKNYEYENWNSDIPQAHNEDYHALYKSIPVLFCKKKNDVYGMFFDNTFHSYLNLGKENPEYYFYGADDGNLDLYFLGGEKLTDLIEEYTYLTGRTPLPQRWTLGYQQSRWGYQCAEDIRDVAEHFRDLDIPCIPRLMIRVKDTRPQKELNGRERENNVKNAFQSPDNVVKYKRILIVDDIYTTGSTVEAVAERLKEAGAEQVYVLTACIGRGF